MIQEEQFLSDLLLTRREGGKNSNLYKKEIPTFRPQTSKRKEATIYKASLKGS